MKKKKEHNLDFGCRTDVGRVRDHNEDNLVASPPLFAVADGMGGHAAGEVASEIAINVLSKNAPKEADAQMLAEAVEKANQEVIKGAMEGKGKQGMGTTMTAAIVENDKIAIAQVGDSRAYLLHNNNLQQITRDHSLMADLIEQGQITPAEARVHPNRSLITRALGSDPNMYADQFEINVDAGDRLMLCSDGLSGMLTDEIIQGLLNEIKDPQECADKLVEQANAHGGNDNITVIVVDIMTSVATKKKKKAVNKVRRGFIIVAILFVAILAGGVALTYNIVNNSAYLSDDDGYIAVYKGVPGSIGNFELYSKEETTDVKISNLRESSQEHFAAGAIKVASLEEAWDAVDNFRNEANDLSKSKSTQKTNQTDASTKK